MKQDNYKPKNYIEDNQWQVKKMMVNQEHIQHKTLAQFRRNNLANNDFSCMMKKD